MNKNDLYSNKMIDFQTLIKSRNFDSKKCAKLDLNLSEVY